MNKFNALAEFDKVIDRRGTSCLKYDFAVERGMPADVLPFWVADMDFQTPAPVVEELVRRSRHGIFGYTDVKDDYREVLRRWFIERHAWEPNTAALVVTPGVVFALCTAVRALTNPEDAVLVCPPVYYPFFAAIKENGRRLVESPLVLREKADEKLAYEIDFADFERKIVENNVKMFLLCSPHNPVGRVWTRYELAAIGEICLRRGVLVVADEIHQDFVRRGFTHTVFAALSPEIADITVTCTAPSKTFNLAGLQISDVFIDNEKLRRKFKREISAAGYSQPNAMGLFAAKAAYEHGGQWLNNLLSYLENNLLFAEKFLADNLLAVRLVEPEGTYLLWLDFSAYGFEGKELDEIISRKAKLWLDDGHIFGTGGAGFTRINIACPQSVLKEGLERLANCFKGRMHK